MRKLVLFSMFSIIVSILHAQEPLQLVASKNRNKHIFSVNTAVKSLYNQNGQMVEIRGRIDSISENSITIRPFNKKHGVRTTIFLADLVQVRKKARTGRVVTGALAGLIGVLSMALIVEDMSDRGEFLDGLGATLGGMTMILGSVPYIVVAASEPVTAKEKGYQFAIVRKK